MSKKSNNQYQEPIHQAQQARTQSGLTSLFWILVGSVITLMVVVFIYLSPLSDAFRGETQVDVNPEATVTPLPQEPTQAGEYEFYEILPQREFRTGEGLGHAQDDSTANAKVDVVVDAKPVDDSQTEITVIEEDSTYDGEDTQKPTPPSKDPSKEDKTDERSKISIQATKNTYILQIRSYDRAQDADHKRAEVMMAGVDARVVRRVDNVTGAEYYQVVSAPMSSREQAMSASRRLSENGIDSLIVEQKRQ